MVEQGQVLHKKDLSWSFHQGLEQYCGQAKEPRETRSRCKSLSQRNGCPSPSQAELYLEVVFSPRGLVIRGEAEGGTQ